jgi:hypothetical protein
MRLSMASLAGILLRVGDEVEGLGVGDGAADLAELEGEQEERGELGGEGLGGGDADLGAGVGGDGALGFAGDGMAPTTLQMARVLEPRAMISRWAARVSAVSPDWVMSRPRALRGSAMGSR